jgi:DNA-binding IclR family transcriptional regulator
MGRHPESSVERVLDALRDEPHCTVRELAEDLGMSTSYTHQLLMYAWRHGRAQWHDPPASYVARRRDGRTARTWTAIY